MVWRALIRPVLFALEPERSHGVAVRGLAWSTSLPPIGALVERRYRVRDPRLAVERFGIRFDNPVGLAGGFDKDARWLSPLARLGFGFIEVGTLTARAQPGNPRPRIFRLPQDEALVNRLGFNNDGAERAAERLARTRRRHCVVGANIGKSRDVPLESAVADYHASFQALFPHVGFLTINVSSPNTPGLRQLQRPAELAALIADLNELNQTLAAQSNQPRRPILVKIAPDLSDAQITDIAAWALDGGIDGIIATNTATGWPPLRTPADTLARIGQGGLSGRPLTPISRRVVRLLYERLGSRIPIVGVGGIMSGEDAWQMICAGASLVEVYTGLIYGGPGFVRDVLRHLSRRLDESGFASIDQAVGRIEAAE